MKPFKTTAETFKRFQHCELSEFRLWKLKMLVNRRYIYSDFKSFTRAWALFGSLRNSDYWLWGSQLTFHNVRSCQVSSSCRPATYLQRRLTVIPKSTSSYCGQGANSTMQKQKFSFIYGLCLAAITFPFPIPSSYLINVGLGEMGAGQVKKLSTSLARETKQREQGLGNTSNDCKGWVEIFQLKTEDLPTHCYCAHTWVCSNQLVKLTFWINLRFISWKEWTFQQCNRKTVVNGGRLQIPCACEAKEAKMQSCSH